MMNWLDRRVIKSVSRGLLSYIPGLLKIFGKGKGAKGTGGTCLARYCYSVWLRHLIVLNENGIKINFKNIAEFGPGDSSGNGLAALITGGESYYALDIIDHSNLNKNLQIFDELKKLFIKQEKIPNNLEFPYIKPEIKSYDFPQHLFDKKKLFSTERLNKIREAIRIGYFGEYKIFSIVPWHTSKEININFDLIFSQAVMEHVKDLELAYKKMYDWLEVNGIISHNIDFSAHETHSVWNGHWNYPNLIWKIVMHGRKYIINRNPLSMHLHFLEKIGFRNIKVFPVISNDGYQNSFFKPQFDQLLPSDYVTTSAHIIAQK